ncbi:unnamed protein product, partial [Rotaria socialis]
TCNLSVTNCKYGATPLRECKLASLAFIDRGSSFMSDTLHSIYHGAFIIATMDPNIKKHHGVYPSVLMKLISTWDIYDRSRSISTKNLNDMEYLLSKFVDQFPYPEQYIVQNIRAVKHFATTVCDFGPLLNYSTFNYESVNGYLSASIHGTKRLASELSCLKAQYYQQMIFSRSKIFTNAAIVYKYMGAINYRKIRKIYYASQQNQHFWAIQPLQNTCYDTLNIEGQVFINENVIFGNILSNEMHLISFEHVIEKACYYERDDLYYFARFPNLHESS